MSEAEPKPVMTLYLADDEVSEANLQFYITQMLSCVHKMDGNTAYSFMKLLDVANLLDLAMDSVNWAELPFQVEIAYIVDGKDERTILEGTWQPKST